MKKLLHVPFPFHTVDLYIKSEPVLVDRTTYKNGSDANSSLFIS